MIRIIEGGEPLLNEIAKTAFERLHLCGEASVELVIMNEEEIRAVNREQRGADKPTDVLSFPLLEKIMPFTEENYPFDFDKESGAALLGSIIICREIAERQAREYGHGTEREYAYLFLHGLLHLLGYDHIEEEDKRKMREAEEDILTAVGVTR